MIERLSLGCHNLTGGSSMWRSERLVRTALALGIKRFDVAPSYGLGTAEATLSRCLGRDRFNPDIEITTKFGIQPPSNGLLLSWLREPYRIARSWLQTPLPDVMASKAGNLPISASESSHLLLPDEGLKRSMQRLRVDSLACYLTHEKISDGVMASLGDSVEQWLNSGQIRRFGCSGETAIACDHLYRLGSYATIAQTSSIDAVLMRGKASELRHFGVMRIASKLREALKDKRFQTLQTSFNELSRTKDSFSVLHGLAASIVIFNMTFPERIVLVNASSGERLEQLLLEIDRKELLDWCKTALAARLTLLM